MSNIIVSPRILMDIIETMKHARIFITSKQRMYSTGIELYEKLLTDLENLGKAEES